MVGVLNVIAVPASPSFKSGLVYFSFFIILSCFANMISWLKTVSSLEFILWSYSASENFVVNEEPWTEMGKVFIFQVFPSAKRFGVPEDRRKSRGHISFVFCLQTKFWLKSGGKSRREPFSNRKYCSYLSPKLWPPKKELLILSEIILKNY